MAQRAKQITISPTAPDADGIFTAVDLGVAKDHLINGALSTGLDADGICASQTPAAGGSQALTINGALGTGVAALNKDYGQYVTITAAADDSGRTFTVMGTGKTGNVISETITGPNTTYAIGALLFWTVTSVTVDADTAGAITVGVNGYVTLSQAQHLTLLSAADASSTTFTISGRNRAGDALSEVITGGATTTVVGINNFSLIQRITASADAVGNMSCGVNGTCEGQWIPLNHYGFTASSVYVDFEGASAAMTYSLESTYDDVFASGFDEHDASPLTDGTMTGETAASFVSISSPVAAIRVDVSAFTSGSAVVRVMPGEV